MSIYLKDDSVVMDSGSVATSSDCCCGGVCCTCEGDCDDTVTQEECEDNGGTWFPTDTCDDNPCDTLTTGACCADTDCSIKTEDCCNNGGGVYQGDDTTCDPNPCEVMPPCNGCGFGAFDMSGRTFLRYTRVVSGSWSASSSDGFNWTSDASCSGIYEAHYDSDCNFIVDEDTSMSHREDVLDPNPPDICDDPNLDCFCNVTIPDHNECTTFFNPCLACSCLPVATDNTVSTATTRTRTVTMDSNNTSGDVTCTWTGSYTDTETLSEECTPP